MSHNQSTRRHFLAQTGLNSAPLAVAWLTSRAAQAAPETAAPETAPEQAGEAPPSV